MYEYRVPGINIRAPVLNLCIKWVNIWIYTASYRHGSLQVSGMAGRAPGALGAGPFASRSLPACTQSPRLSLTLSNVSSSSGRFGFAPRPARAAGPSALSGRGAAAGACHSCALSRRPCRQADPAKARLTAGGAGGPWETSTVSPRWIQLPV